MDSDEKKYNKISLDKLHENNKKIIINKFGFDSLFKTNNAKINEKNFSKFNSDSDHNKSQITQFKPILIQNYNKNVTNTKVNCKSCSLLLNNIEDNKQKKKSRNYNNNSTDNLPSNKLNYDSYSYFHPTTKIHNFASTKSNTHTSTNLNKMKKNFNIIHNHTHNSEEKFICNRLFKQNNTRSSKKLLNDLLLQAKPVIKSKGEDNNPHILEKLLNKLNSKSKNNNLKTTNSKNNNLKTTNSKNLIIKINNNPSIKNITKEKKISILRHVEENISHSTFNNNTNYISPKKECKTINVAMQSSNNETEENVKTNSVINNKKTNQLYKENNIKHKEKPKIKYITQNDSKIDNDLNNSNTIKKENNSLINTINYKILVNNDLNEEKKIKNSSKEDSSFNNLVHLYRKEEEGKLDDETDEIDDVENEEIIRNNGLYILKEQNKKYYRLLSRGYSYNVSSRYLKKEDRIMIKNPQKKEEYLFIGEVENKNRKIPMLNLKKFMKLENLCIYKILSFVPEMYEILIKSDNYFAKKIIYSLKLLFKPTIENFKYIYNFLDVLNYNISISNIIYHKKKFPIINLEIICKIKTKKTKFSYDISCNYISDNKKYDYLWKIDIQNKKNIEIWINNEINPSKNNIRNFSHTSQINSFAYGDELKIFFNISNLIPKSIEWVEPVITPINPEVYRKGKFLSKVAYDSLRASEIENQILFWNEKLEKQQILLSNEIKKIYENYFEIKEALYDKSKYDFYRIEMIAKQKGTVVRNKYCSFDIKIVDFDSTVQNEIQCVYFMNSNFYSKRMEIRVGTKLFFYIIDMR